MIDLIFCFLVVGATCRERSELLVGIYTAKTFFDILSDSKKMEDVNVVKKEEIILTDPSTTTKENEAGAGDETQVTTVTKKGKIRKRKKALHTAIRNQMEFYFSDANLSKDRFMQNAIKDGPGIYIFLVVIIFFMQLIYVSNCRSSTGSFHEL